MGQAVSEPCDHSLSQPLPDPGVHHQSPPVVGNPMLASDRTVAPVPCQLFTTLPFGWQIWCLQSGLTRKWEGWFRGVSQKSHS